ncbi:alginate O-acetyltransferase [Aquipseudomonas ullengensis]|uniref:Probable alginate O-acetylase AlgJ n=1 Tax=Aquipseudomonas ullengensis TaxID=2759166 RepID=A0A7W4LN15_9GAMM|nr:alginate O-acetyltransferase [Pseudomonas ullengensis]MBB2496148.1 alginate O-acetyltransferase [Pseudomonas ullengensis]
MTRSLNILYSLVFIGLMLALSLASVPALLSFSTASETTVLNGKLAHAIEKHYDKNFPVKEFGTNAWAALDYSLFGEGRPGVVVGTGDWLFTDEEFKPASNPKQLQDNWALIGAVQQEFKRRNIELVLALLPAKARLYPEQFGEDKPVAAQQELYARVHQLMQAQQVAGPDLLPALQQAKRQEPVFLRTDTHWTPYGAEVVARSLATYLSAQPGWAPGSQQFVTETAASQPHKGDLLSFLPLDPYFSGLQPPAETLQPRSTEVQEASGEESGDLFGSEQPQLALVGTSYSANPKWNFAGALKQALGSDLLNYAEDGHGPLVPMLRLLSKGQAETAGLRFVVWEVPERYLMMPSDLSGFDRAWLDRLRASEQLAATDALKM